MAWHKIDYDGLWSSEKLNRCSDGAEADDSWVCGTADGSGGTSHLHLVLVGQCTLLVERDRHSLRLTAGSLIRLAAVAQRLAVEEGDP